MTPSLRYIPIACLLVSLSLLDGQTPPTPFPPCGQEALPFYPDPDAPPLVTFWDEAAFGRGWQAPECTNWKTPGFATLVTTVARFRSPSGEAGLRQRIAAISQLSGMRYWSTTHQQWQTLVVRARALNGVQSAQAREDFSAEEIRQGAVLYFEQTDNLSGRAVYRMHISEATPLRLVFDVENITTMRYLLVTLFHPGEMQSVYFLDREPDGVWRYYSMTRTGRNASRLTAGHPASSINRAVAFYRSFAGIPTDLEPPAAR